MNSFAIYFFHEMLSKLLTVFETNVEMIAKSLDSSIWYCQ